MHHSQDGRTATILLVSRALRGWADGAVSVLLVGYLTRLGLSPFEVGAIVTGTLFGSALLTIAVGLAAARLRVHRVLFGACALMVCTGIGFASLTSFWPLFIVAVAGTLNPSSGDVSVFLPMEQTLVAGATSASSRTVLFARYNLVATLAGGIGALGGGFLARHADPTSVLGERLALLGYAAIGLVLANLYRGLPRPEARAGAAALAPLRRPRRVVLQLAALFSLDAFGGGFVVQSMLVLWLSQRFAMRSDVVGVILFVASLLGAASQLLSPRVAERIGLVRTMVYTHLPANLFLVLAGVVSDARLAILFLLLRSALSQMDVPARQSYVMSVVPPEERPAASSLTNVPRSLAACAAPLLTGMMLAASSFGWPLVCGGLTKALYDLLLLRQFGRSSPAEGA
ncbi:MAG TPA: MFS transporter [Polyangiaceae bacterium]|nr:MFS transporter [Polyangiaceae bacterium]